jgi:hypothetical protein
MGVAKMHIYEYMSNVASIEHAFNTLLNEAVTYEL